ncbi:MAG: HAMP domain-containing protein [Deltaproteobacteria bacterium]|nr:HAMP domain-containing protein [Deltaproteobacteria bacterium]
MTLRNKIVLIIGLTFLCLITVLYGVTSKIILGSFIRLEEENLQVNVNRVLDALQNNLVELESTGGDWGPWNDTRDFIQNKNEDYIRDNLGVATLMNLRVHFFIFIDPLGQLIHAAGIDFSNEGEERTVSKALIDHVLSHPFLLRHAHSRDAKTGIIILPENPALLSAWPVSNSNFEEPIVGTFILGRYIDEKEIYNLGKRTHLSISFQRMDEPRMTEDFGMAMATLSNDVSFTSHALTPDTIAGYGVQHDIYGNPSLILRVDMPREILRKGKESIHYFMGVLLIVGLIVLVVFLATLQSTVLGPIKHLTNHILSIGESGDLHFRLSFGQKDEIGILAREFNRMLEQLSDARDRLLEQSYYSGLAEMASGILHNIRNSLMPVAGQVHEMMEKINNAPIKNMEEAINELNDEYFDPQRERSLNRYLMLGCNQIISLVKDTRPHLMNISRQIAHIEEILVGQDQYSHFEKKLEPLHLGRILEHAIQLMPQDLKNNVSIEVDPGISKLPNVSAERIFLTQVITNLLNNAAESIQRKGIEAGNIRISGDMENKDSIQRVHMIFRDNGEGMDSIGLKNIFTRGYSKKGTRSSGIGLHWCGNVVSAMRGELYAESDGIGQGTGFHLKLPADSCECKKNG